MKGETRESWRNGEGRRKERGKYADKEWEREREQGVQKRKANRKENREQVKNKR